MCIFLELFSTYFTLRQPWALNSNGKQSGFIQGRNRVFLPWMKPDHSPFKLNAHGAEGPLMKGTRQLVVTFIGKVNYTNRVIQCLKDLEVIWFNPRKRKIGPIPCITTPLTIKASPVKGRNQIKPDYISFSIQCMTHTSLAPSPKCKIKQYCQCELSFQSWCQWRTGTQLELPLITTAKYIIIKKKC